MNDHRDHRKDGGHRGGDDDAPEHPHHHGHHHDHGHREGRGHGGPPDTSWLQLEISRVIADEAEGIAREAAREIVREVVRERVRERLREHVGERLASIGRAVADRFVDDNAASLDIEARIGERRAARRASEEHLDEALRSKKGAPET
jgi:ABC-type Zn2+ transport system substrate-binding protein/surface adhesin